MTLASISNSLMTLLDRQAILNVLARDCWMGLAKQLCGVFLIFSLVSCSGAAIKQDEDADAKSVVAKRAQSRWDALIKGDLAAAYEYLSPGTRVALSLEGYKAKVRPGRWKKVSVESVACERDRCDIIIILEYSYRDMKSIESRQSETWLHEGDKWWYVPRK